MLDCLRHGSEADRLSIYFEEKAKYERKKARQSQNAPSGAGAERAGYNYEPVGKETDKDQEDHYEDDEE